MSQLRFLPWGTSLQRVVLAYSLGSASAALMGDFVWAYYFASTGLKFPSAWSVFRFSVEISAVTVVVATALFAGTLWVGDRSWSAASGRSGLLASVGLGIASQLAILLAPHVSDRFNPVLLILILCPVLAGAACVVCFGSTRTDAGSS